MPPLNLEFKKDIPKAFVSLDNLMAFQRIRGLVITPRPESVRIRFNTNLVTTTVVEIFRYLTGSVFDDPVPQNLVASQMELFGGPRAHHDFDIGGLPQDTRLWFKVTATSSDPTVPRAHALGQFLTLSRTARVRFDELTLWRSGDSDSPGEMLFNGAAYDFASKLMIAGQFRRPANGRESINNGTILGQPFGAPGADINNAPQVITLWVEASDEDCLDVPWPWADVCGRGEKLPQDSVPAVGHGEIANYVWASAADDVALPVTVGDYSVPFKLNSGNWGVAFSLSGRIEGTVRPASYALPAPVTWTMEPWQKKVGKTTLRHPGQPAGIGDLDGRFELLTIAPDRSLHRRSMGAESHRDDQSWMPAGGRIAGPLTAIHSNGGRIDVFAVTPEATVAHASWPSFHTAGEPEWRDLGGRMAGDITAIPREDVGVDVLAVGTDDAVYHRFVTRWDGEADGGEWVDLGGRVKGPLAAHSSVRGLEICALDTDGTVHHAVLALDGSGPGRAEWKSIGGQFTGPLVIVPRERDGFALFAFNEDRTVSAKAYDGRAWSPSGPEWARLGTIDELAVPEDAEAEQPSLGGAVRSGSHTARA